MHGTQLVTGITGAVHEHDLCIGMSQQNSDELTCRITGTTYYSYFNHLSSGITNAQIR